MLVLVKVMVNASFAYCCFANEIYIICSIITVFRSQCCRPLYLPEELEVDDMKSRRLKASIAIA
jgi:hypothetical protein